MIEGYYPETVMSKPDYSDPAKWVKFLRGARHRAGAYAEDVKAMPLENRGNWYGEPVSPIWP
jgi:hypothetical protein